MQKFLQIGVDLVTTKQSLHRSKVKSEIFPYWGGRGSSSNSWIIIFQILCWLELKYGMILAKLSKLLFAGILKWNMKQVFRISLVVHLLYVLCTMVHKKKISGNQINITCFLLYYITLYNCLSFTKKDDSNISCFALI